MKLHLPHVLRRSLLAVMALASSVFASGASPFAAAGSHYEVTNFNSKTGSYDFALKNDWKSITTKSFVDASGNTVKRDTYYKWFALDVLYTRTDVTVTQNSSGTYSHRYSYFNDFLNDVDGGGEDYIRSCTAHDAVSGEESPGMWILAPSYTPDNAVYRMTNYGDIRITDCRQEYVLYTPISATEYERKVYNLKDASLLNFYCTATSSHSFTSVGFNLDVSDSDSFTYINAYTAGTGSFSSGAHSYVFTDVKNIDISNNHAEGNGGVFYGDRWSFYVDRAENVRIVGNTAAGAGSFGYANQTSVWSGEKNGGVQIQHVTGEVLFKDNEGSCMLRNVSCRFDDINRLTFSSNSGVLFSPYNADVYVEMNNCRDLIFDGNGDSEHRSSLFYYQTSSIYNAMWTITDCSNVTFSNNLCSSYLAEGLPPLITRADNVVFSGNHAYEGVCLTADLVLQDVGKSVQIVNNIAEYSSSGAAYGALFSGNGRGSVTANGAAAGYADLFRMSGNSATGNYIRGFINGGLSLTRFNTVELNENIFEGENNCASLFSVLDVSAVNSVSANGNVLHSVAKGGGLFESVNVSDFGSFTVKGNSIAVKKTMIASLLGTGIIEGRVSSSGEKQSTLSITDNEMQGSTSGMAYGDTRYRLTIHQLDSFLYQGNRYEANAGEASMSLMANPLTLAGNNSVSIMNNTSVSADRVGFAGGIGNFASVIDPSVSSRSTIFLSGNGNVVVSGNRVEGKVGAYGGGIFSNDCVYITGNESVSFTGNSAKAEAIADVWTETGRDTFTNTWYASDYDFGNGALGGALFAEEAGSGMKIYNNAHFVSRGNYVTDGTTYHLQGIATSPSGSRDTYFAAPENGTMELYDGLFIGYDLVIGMDEQAIAQYPEYYSKEEMNLGKVLFSGKYAEQDLAAIKKAAGAGAVTKEELEASRTYYVTEGIVVEQGELEVSDGAHLRTEGRIVLTGKSAKLSVLRGASISAEDPLPLFGQQRMVMDRSSFSVASTISSDIRCTENAVLRVEGPSVLNLGRLNVSAGGTLSLNVTEENAETAVLTLNCAPQYGYYRYAPGLVVGADVYGMNAEAAGYLELTTTGTLAAGDYILLTMNQAENGAEPICLYNPENSVWTSGQAVTGLGKGDSLSWVIRSDDRADLVWHVAKGVVPQHRDAATLTWNGASGQWKNNAEGAWTSSVSDLKFYDGDKVVFGSAATVDISGSVAPSSVEVKNTSGTVVISSANGGGIAGTAGLTKSGNGVLSLNTANGYSGGTSVSGGTVNIGHASALGSGVVTISGGSLAMDKYAVANDIVATGGSLSGSAYQGNLTVKGNVSIGSGFSAGSVSLESGRLTGNLSTADVSVLTAAGGTLSGNLTLNGGTFVADDAPLTVSGTLTLASSTVLDLSAYKQKGQYTLVSAGGISGNVSTLVYDKTQGHLSYSVTREGQNLVLDIVSSANRLTWTLPKGVWTSGGVIGNGTFETGDFVEVVTPAGITVKGTVAPGALQVNSNGKVVLTSDKKTPGSGIAGDGSVTKDGEGMLTMNAGNTYMGGTVLNAGTMKATAIDSFGFGTITVKGGTLDLGSKAVINAIVLSGDAIIKGDAKYTGSVTVEGDATLLAKTSYKGMTTIGEDSSLTLAEKATMAGSVVVNGGSLNITAPKGMTLAKGAMMLLDNGGTVSGPLTIGAGSMLVWADGSFETAAPVLKGGTLSIGGEGALMLAGSKAQVQFGDKRVELPGKGLVYTDEPLTVNGGTVTVSALNGYDGGIEVAGGMLKLATGKVTADNAITVSGDAAVVNGKMHFGDITVNGTLTKGTNITIAADKTVELNGAGIVLGTIAGSGTVDVNTSIDATAAKITAAHINLNSGTYTNAKGIKLAKGQTLTLGGVALNLGSKGALATAAGSTLAVSGSNTLSGSLTLGGGELVFESGSLAVDGMLTLSKAMTVSGSGTITYTTLKPFKGDIAALFNGAEVELDAESGTLTINGGVEQRSRVVSAPLDTTPALPQAPVTNPVADAMVQADWGIIDAERAFLGAVNSRHQHAALLDKGQGAAWVSAFGSSVRHGNKGVHHGSDGNIEGAAFGLEHAVSETGSIGLAIGRSKNRIAATGVTHLRQETAHVALYGQKQFAHGFTADAAASYGDTETKLGAASWQQKSAALTARLTHAQQLTEATAFRTFGGLAYEATESGSIGAAHTGSVQNFRGELGAGITHTSGKAHLYAEAALTGDMVRHNPTADLGGFRTHGANPGRIGVRATIGGLYEFTDTWSGTASYGIEAESRSTSHTLNIGVSKTF